MDERTERRILQKAEYVGDAIKVLVRKRDSLSFEEYRAQREQRDVVEREFETAIEACIDIGEMILTAESDGEPSTNAEVFHELGNRDVLDAETARRMHRRRASETSSRISMETKSTTRTSTTSSSKSFRSFSTTWNKCETFSSDASNWIASFFRGPMPPHFRYHLFDSRIRKHPH